MQDPELKAKQISEGLTRRLGTTDVDVLKFHIDQRAPEEVWTVHKQLLGEKLGR